MLAWCIINTILLVAAFVDIICVTVMWFRAEKKLARFGQSFLYKRVKNNKKCKKRDDNK